MSFYTKKQYEQPTMDTKKLREIVDSFYSGYYKNCDEFTNNINDELYDSDLSEQFGGEGDGAGLEHIWKITEKSTGEFGYISFEGEYSSWDASHWEDEYGVVKPKSISVTQFL